MLGKVKGKGSKSRIRTSTSICIVISKSIIIVIGTYTCTHTNTKNMCVLPADVVLGLLFDEADALEHVCNVIDAALLHRQLRSGLVQVERAVRRGLEEINKLAGKMAERRVVSRLADGSGACGHQR